MKSWLQTQRRTTSSWSHSALILSMLLFLVKEDLRNYWHAPWRYLRFDLGASSDDAGPQEEQTWVCGQNTGAFLARRNAPAQQQTQVIMVNTYLNLRKLSQKKLADLCACLPGADPKARLQPKRDT